MKKELKGSLSDEKLAELKKKISESLALDRHGLIFDFPFTASLMMRLDLIPTRDKRNMTACTDGKSIYFDCDFYTRLSKKERAFVLAHEVWHNVLLHLSRKQTRDAQLFNIATDMEVNHLLASEAAGKSIEPPEGLLFPPKNLEGKSAEVIYDYLLKQAKKEAKKVEKQAQQMPGMPSAGSGGSGENDSADENESECESQEEESAGSGNQSGKQKQKKDKKDSKQKGSGSDADGEENGDNTTNKHRRGNKKRQLKGQFDGHIYQGDDDDEGDGKVEDQWGEVGFDEDFRPRVSDDYADQMREAAIAAAQACERQQGDLPAGVKSLLDKVTKPEMNWRELLSQFVTSCYNGSRKWLPPNRRHVYNEMYFQSRRDEMLTGAVCIDTSGSCIGDLPKFFGELKGLIETFGGYKIYVVQADAAVDQVDVYDSADNPLDPEFGSKIDWSGGGGTDYGPFFKWIDTKYFEREGKMPDFVVYVGDGYAAMSYRKTPTYPVLWLLTKDGNENFCEWGKKLHFKENAYDY
jgi:predicted metal-dependent peptidase